MFTPKDILCLYRMRHPTDFQGTTFIVKNAHRKVKRRNARRGLYTADMTVSTYGYRIAKEDLKAKVIRGAGNTVLKTQWNRTLDDLDSDAAAAWMYVAVFIFSEVPWIAKYCGPVVQTHMDCTRREIHSTGASALAISALERSMARPSTIGSTSIYM